MTKEELVQVETEKLNGLIQIALEKHHIRESWVEDNCHYNTAGMAVPDSVLEFTKIYFEGLSKVLEKI